MSDAKVGETSEVLATSYEQLEDDVEFRVEQVHARGFDARSKRVAKILSLSERRTVTRSR